MTSDRPYLLRAMYEWIIDNGMTPLLVVNADPARGAQVPQNYIENGRIILNVHPAAVKDLDLGNQAVIFGARFGGAPFQIYVPMTAVMAIYARENGKGFAFNDNPEQNSEGPQDNEDNSSGRRPAPHLTIVK